MASLSDLQSYAAQMAGQYGINPTVFAAQIAQESGWNSSAVNGNAVGIAQFMPGTAQQYGVDPTNPYSSLQGAAAYDSALLNSPKCNGDYNCMLQSYGTTANVPQSVSNKFSGLLDSLGLGSNAPNSMVVGNLQAPFGGLSGSPLGKIQSYIGAGAVRIGIGLLAIVLIAGAIYTYKGKS